MLCKYKDSLGVPGKGLHKPKIGGVAAFDFILTILLAWGTSVFSKRCGKEIPLTITLIFWLVISVIIHKIFCVETNISKFLGI